MKNNLLIVGGDSKIAGKFIDRHTKHYNVYCTSRKINKPNSRTVHLDLADTNSVNALIEDLSHVKFDGVVCFVSTYYHKIIPEIRTIENDLQVNFLGIYRIAKNLNLANNSKIILLSDSALYQPKREYFGYSVSKMLLNLYAKQLAVDLAPGTSTNLICLGPVMTNKTGKEKEKYFKKSLIRVEDPQEGLVNLIDFLLREENLHMTGTEIIYDGGRMLNRV